MGLIGDDASINVKGPQGWDVCFFCTEEWDQVAVPVILELKYRG